MRSIMFHIQPGLDESKRASIVKQVRALAGIELANPLRPGAKNDSLQRMFFARVSDQANIEELRRRIANLDQVESAEIPAIRGLPSPPATDQSYND
jgi:hypothetical protein